MWVGKFQARDGGSTPSSQPGSRPYSPLPRRPSSNLSPYVTSQRPGLTPRGSSISLVSNDSSTSLLGSSRKVIGSNLKHSTTVHDGPSPEAILEKLLGTKSEGGGQNQPHSITDEDLELECDFGGLSLRELAAEKSPRSPEARQHLSSAQNCEIANVNRDIWALLTI
jgi:vacuolar protein sorting-associated protein 52